MMHDSNIENASFEEDINRSANNVLKTLIGNVALAPESAGTAGVDTLDVSEIDPVAEYTDICDEFAEGPQIEGIAPDLLTVALDDPDTVSIKLQESSRLPIFVPMKYSPWLNPDFFTDKGYVTDDLYYCALPQSFISKIKDSADGGIGVFKKLHPSGGIVVDYPESSGISQVFLQECGQVDDLVTKAGTPAATFHYRMDCIEKTDADRSSVEDPNVVLMGPEDVDSHFNDIWKIYSEQFQQLVDDHPVNGKLSESQLREALSHPDLIMRAYWDEGKIRSFGYVTGDLKQCPWLNSDYFEDNSNALPVFYSAGIATSNDYHKSVSSKLIKSMLVDVFRVTDGKFQLTFECSNRSAQYIPVLIERALNRSGLMEQANVSVKKHLYKLISMPLV